MLSDRIEQARQEVHETNVANQIIDMLDKLRLSNNEYSPRRWVWELCQNAKDVCNSSGKIMIKIHFDEERKKMEFCHNGRAFNLDNIVCLIEKASSKDRKISDVAERKSGKFGTGFLTTHLLSSKVEVSGILANEGDIPQRFNILLDRSGESKEEIIDSIRRSFEQLYSSQPITDGVDLDHNCYNTIFTYDLDEAGLKVAKLGLQDLESSIPYVLSMLHEIKEIKVEPHGITYKYFKEIECSLENATVHEIIISKADRESHVFILNLTENDVTISVALVIDGDKVMLKEYDFPQPKLFCDFPLIGTDKFPFPVIVQSSNFNPTEPRDGVHLTDVSSEKIKENKSIMLEAVRLYKTLLEYISKKGWGGIYNITRIDNFEKKEWLSKEWLEVNVIEECKKAILQTPIIDTCDGTRIELEDFLGDEQALIISNPNEELRNDLWSLGSKIYPDLICRKADIHRWYNSLWVKCKNFTVREMTKRLHSIGNIEALTSALVDKEWIDWLEGYYKLISMEKNLFNEIQNDEYAIVPNQNGDFRKLSDMWIDDNIEPVYKEVLKLMNTDCNEWLVHADIKIDNWFKCKTYGNRDILLRIEEAVEDINKENKKEIYIALLCLIDRNAKEENNQKKVIEFANAVFDLRCEIKYVDVVSKKLQEDAMKSIITHVADYISEMKEIKILANSIGFSEEEVLIWLADLIDFLVKAGYDHLLNKSTRPILPNQNGQFLTKDDLFLDNEIDNILKDLSFIAGYDVRKELLDQNIYLQLPDNREKKEVDLTSVITQYVKEHRGSSLDKEETKFFFRTLLIWINENEGKAAHIFGELFEKKFWLYDDKEIALNMKKAEAYDSLMDKYDISSPEKLEKILCQSSLIELPVEKDKELITVDTLVQWGIDSEEGLEKAYRNDFFADHFIRDSEHNIETFEYVKQILDRSKKRIIEYLNKKSEYDLTTLVEVDKTIFLMKKNGEEIFLIARPSDYQEVRIFYKSEKDILDYTKDWELWVENGLDEPEKITFGKMLKLTGINRIPLKNIREIG